MGVSLLRRKQTTIDGIREAIKVPFAHLQFNKVVIDMKALDVAVAKGYEVDYDQGDFLITNFRDS